MPKLIVNPGTSQAFDLELKPGINSLGREAENDFPIEHESVAGRHCEIHVSETEVILLDLGSASGTQVDGAKIEQISLKDGQSLMIGEVALQFISEPATMANASQSSPLPVALDCRFHPKSPARYFCNKCAKAYCPICVGHQLIGGVSRVTCRKCGSPCAELALHVPETSAPPPFSDLALGAFRYPVQHDGWVLLAGGTLFFLVISFLERGAGFAGPYGGFAALVIGIFGAGTLVAYMQRIVAASAMGEDRLPDWPDFSNWQDDIMAPLFQTGSILVLCFWPLVLLQFNSFAGQPGVQAALIAGAVVGLVYFPMALLAVYMADTITALDPRIVVPAIVRLRSQYWMVCALLATVLGISLWLRAALESLLHIPILPALLSGFASLYFLTAKMRLLGVMHWCNRERLGWVKGV